MSKVQHSELHNTEHNHGTIWKTVANATQLAALLITDDDITGARLIRQTDTNEVYRPVSTTPTFRKVSDANKFSTTETLVEARTGRASLNQGSNTLALDTKTEVKLVAAETTNKTIYTQSLATGQSLYVVVICLALTTTQASRAVEKYEGWFNNIAGVVSKDAEQASSNLGGTGHISGSFSGTDISIVYNGPAADLYPIIQLGAAPPGSWV